MVPYKKKKEDNHFAIGTPRNDLPRRKTALCWSNKIHDTASQASTERTSLVSMLAFLKDSPARSRRHPFELLEADQPLLLPERQEGKSGAPNERRGW